MIVESMILRSRDDNFFTSSDFRENDGIATAFRKVFDPLLLLEKDVRSQAWSKQFAVSESPFADKFLSYSCSSFMSKSRFYRLTG